MAKEINFKYESVPLNYAHCFNHQCVKRDKCMHYLVGEHATPLRPTIPVINPVCVPEDTNACPHFHLIRTIRMAWGIKNLLNNVPQKDVKALKSQMFIYFGRNNYYRLYRKERGLLPQQQEYIRRIFQQKGISEELAFEYYTEEYQWH